MATTIYTCGPSALATILKSIGIYTSEAEIAQLSGTDETGTTLYGLKTAANAKGITAIAARLTIDKLQANYLVVLTINGVNHLKSCVTSLILQFTYSTLILETFK